MTTYMRLLSSRGSPGFWDNVPRGGPKVHDFSQHLQVYAPSGDRVTFPIGLEITKTLRCEADELPDGAETIQVEGTTYYYADWSFYQVAPGGGYVVVEPPAGAEVSAIPEEAVAHEEGEVALYQFDEIYFTKDTNDAGQEIYRVEPQPPEEEIDAIPADAPSFVADGETYHYVNYNLYVEYEENGQTGFVNGEPEIGAQLDELPVGATTIEEDGLTFYQFDTVFFEEVEDENGQPFYEVIESPDGSETVELEGA
jgi:hypothetical protein